jgi:hypothetical protein
MKIETLLERKIPKRKVLVIVAALLACVGEGRVAEQGFALHLQAT